MRQPNLFPEPRSEERFELPDAELVLVRGFLDAHAADAAFELLQEATPWRQETGQMFGRAFVAPRLTAWYGDPGASYVYSGERHPPLPWTPKLAALRRSVEAWCGVRRNSVLLNLYRDGGDSVGWHSDDERELGPAPAIASLSLGEERVFQLRHKVQTDLERVDLTLPHGSLLWMAGDCQRFWKHQIPKRSGSYGPRINLTFREILH